MVIPFPELLELCQGLAGYRSPSLEVLLVEYFNVVDKQGKLHDWPTPRHRGEHLPSLNEATSQHHVVTWLAGLD